MKFKTRLAAFSGSIVPQRWLKDVPWAEYREMPKGGARALSQSRRAETSTFLQDIYRPHNYIREPKLSSVFFENLIGHVARDIKHLRD